MYQINKKKDCMNRGLPVPFRFPLPHFSDTLIKYTLHYLKKRFEKIKFVLPCQLKNVVSLIKLVSLSLILPIKKVEDCNIFMASAL